MTSDPVYDAAVHNDRLAALDDAREYHQVQVAKEIRETFRSMVGADSLAGITLPITDNSGWKELKVSADEVIFDRITDGKPLEAFFRLLTARDDDAVLTLKALRDALAEAHIDKHADEVGDLRAVDFRRAA